MKTNNAYKSIGEVAKILGLMNNKTGKPRTHTIRFWEKCFKQVKPKIFNGSRRYYDEKTIKLLRKIKYLLKDKGMTIDGVKKQFSYTRTLELDENINHSINAHNEIKKKLLDISLKLKRLKKL